MWPLDKNGIMLARMSMRMAAQAGELPWLPVSMRLRVEPKHRTLGIRLGALVHSAFYAVMSRQILGIELVYTYGPEAYAG